MPYKVFLTDDHEIFRNGLKMLLNKLDGVKVVGEAANGSELITSIQKFIPDIVFLDINMPVMDGIQAAEKIKSDFPKVKIIILTTYSDNEYFDKMVSLGVEGYMLKNADMEEFHSAIRKVMAGNIYYSGELLVQLSQFILSEKKEQEIKTSLPKFTDREMEVLLLLCKGFSNDLIGEELHISDRTVERYKTILMQKTNTENTLNLVIFAFRNRIVQPEE